MSYVIQNFYLINPNINLNQKTYLLWLSRNVHVIIAFMLKGLNDALFFSYSQIRPLLLRNLFTIFYSKGLPRLFKNLTKKWKSFTTINLNKSLQHFTLSQGIALVNEDSNLLQLSPIKLHPQSLFLNQYFTNKTMSNINMHGKFYRITLLKLLVSLQSNWSMWNKNYKLTYGFLILSPQFYNFVYLNHYFFKVYNF